MSETRPRRATRTTQPLGACDLDPSNRFATFIQLAYYPITGATWYMPRTYGVQIKPIVAGQTHAGPSPYVSRSATKHGRVLGSNGGSTVWTGRTYPPALLPSKNFAIVAMIHATARTWQSLGAPRLFDTSTGASLRMEMAGTNFPSVTVQTSCFGAGGSTFVIDGIQPDGPLVFATNHTGSGAIRSYLRADIDGIAPYLVGTTTLTIDADPGGANCRCDVFGSASNTGNVAAAGVFWLAHPTGRIITDAEILEFMSNPWQVFMPDVRRTRRATAAGGFFSRYNYDMVGAD
jgi:hypothetical protein